MSSIENSKVTIFINVFIAVKIPNTTINQDAETNIAIKSNAIKIQETTSISYNTYR